VTCSGGMPSKCSGRRCGALFASASRRRIVEVERGKTACLGAVGRALALLWGDDAEAEADGAIASSLANGSQHC
jgi:hypothetical protein